MKNIDFLKGTVIGWEEGGEMSKEEFLGVLCVICYHTKKTFVAMYQLR